MWQRQNSVVRRVAMSCTAGMISTAVFTAAVTQHGPLQVRQASYDVQNLASIVDSTTTIGISDNLYLLGNMTDIDKTLSMMQSLGVTDVRIDIPWAFIQPNNASTSNWTLMDQIVNDAASRGMGVLGVLNATPSWAGQYIVGHPDPTAFATFASTVASRYGSKIAAYEIWNEPNASFSYNPVDPTAYTALLKAGYTAIKAATNGAAEVIGAVVGAGPTQGTTTMDPVTFVTKMFAAGAQGYFDALSFHPYNSSTEFSQGPSVLPAGTSPLDQVTAIRALLAAHGDSALKIWITEYGEPTNVVSEATQAAYLKDMIQSWQSFAGGGPIFLYNTRDTSADPTYDVADNNFGLYYYNWTAKAAAAVVKSLIASLKPVTNPFTALLAAIQQAFTSWANSFTSAVQKFFASLAAVFGGKSASASTSTAATKAKSATASAAAASTAAKPVAAAAAVTHTRTAEPAESQMAAAPTKNNHPKVHPVTASATSADTAGTGPSAGAPKTDSHQHGHKSKGHASAQAGTP